MEEHRAGHQADGASAATPAHATLTHASSQRAHPERSGASRSDLMSGIGTLLRQRPSVSSIEAHKPPSSAPASASTDLSERKDRDFDFRSFKEGTPMEHHLYFQFKLCIAQITAGPNECAELFFSLYSAVRSPRRHARRALAAPTLTLEVSSVLGPAGHAPTDTAEHHLRRVPRGAQQPGHAQRHAAAGKKDRDAL